MHALRDHKKCHISPQIINVMYIYIPTNKEDCFYKITKYVSLKQLLLSTQMRDKITESFGIPKEIR